MLLMRCLYYPKKRGESRERGKRKRRRRSLRLLNTSTRSTISIPLIISHCCSTSQDRQSEAATSSTHVTQSYWSNWRSHATHTHLVVLASLQEGSPISPHHPLPRHPAAATGPPPLPSLPRPPFPCQFLGRSLEATTLVHLFCCSNSRSVLAMTLQHCPLVYRRLFRVPSMDYIEIIMSVNRGKNFRSWTSSRKNSDRNLTGIDRVRKYCSSL